MSSRFRVTQFLTATSFVLSLLACSSNDAAPDGGSKGGTPGPAATGGSLGKGGAQGLGGAIGTGGKGSGGVLSPDGGRGTGGLAVPDGGPGNGGATGTGGKGAAGTTGGSGEYGFTYRSPGSHTVSCTGTTGTQTSDEPDMDWLCTFNQAGQKGYVYARATATSAKCLMGIVPVFTVESAQISIGGVVTDLANPVYDMGGGHENDSLSFDYQNASYKYYHSSFGFGFRACQPMDCINVYAIGGTTPTTEGCASTRSLPEVCVQIKAGGTHDPLADKFAKCPGDKNN